jgi:hypothetical protein
MIDLDQGKNMDVLGSASWQQAHLGSYLESRLLSPILFSGFLHSISEVF